MFGRSRQVTPLQRGLQRCKDAVHRHGGGAHAAGRSHVPSQLHGRSQCGRGRSTTTPVPARSSSSTGRPDEARRHDDHPAGGSWRPGVQPHLDTASTTSVNTGGAAGRCRGSHHDAPDPHDHQRHENNVTTHEETDHDRTLTLDPIPPSPRAGQVVDRGRVGAARSADRHRSVGNRHHCAGGGDRDQCAFAGVSIDCRGPVDPDVEPAHRTRRGDDDGACGAVQL